MREITVPADAFDDWRIRAGEGFRGLFSDPRDVLPSARSIRLLLYPYAPFLEEEGLPAVSAYYFISNTSYNAAKQMGRVTDCIPIKPALVRSGQAFYGRNGLVSAFDFGTRFVAQCILSEKEADMTEPQEGYRLADACAHCDVCKKACPVGAIDGSGAIDLSRCLRALDEAAPVPLEKRRLLGRHILGCDICQNVCPRNRHIAPVPMPKAVREAVSLEKLLAGDVKPLAELIGPNMARKRRIQSRACIAAANMGRRDLLPIMEQLCSSDFPALAQHAQWAVEVLREK